MSKATYFFAGSYPIVMKGEPFSQLNRNQYPRSTEIVCTSLGKPYTYENEVEARMAYHMAKHHSGLYRLAANETIATRVQSATDNRLTPETLNLTERHLRELGGALN